MMTASLRPASRRPTWCWSGVSRSSKTPTCFYLANRGIKAANVPLVPNLPDPPGLEAPHCPVIGLTLDVGSLIEIRRHRLAPDRRGHRRRASCGQDAQEYVDEDAVEGRAALGPTLVQPARLAGDRRNPPLDRGNRRHGAAVDGSLASTPSTVRRASARLSRAHIFSQNHWSNRLLPV